MYVSGAALWLCSLVVFALDSLNPLLYRDSRAPTAFATRADEARLIELSVKYCISDSSKRQQVC